MERWQNTIVLIKSCYFIRSVRKSPMKLINDIWSNQKMKSYRFRRIWKVKRISRRTILWWKYKLSGNRTQILLWPGRYQFWRDPGKGISRRIPACRVLWAGYGFSRLRRRLLEKFQRQLWIWAEVYYRVCGRKIRFWVFWRRKCGKHLVGLSLLKSVLEPTN